MKVELPLEVNHGPGDACGGVEGRKQLLSQLNSLHLKNLPDGQNKNTLRDKTVLYKSTKSKNCPLTKHILHQGNWSKPSAFYPCV